MGEDASNPYMERAEANAVRRARRGDLEAFQSLVRRHSGAVFRLAYRMTGNEADADDMVQEAFLKAHNHIHRFETRAGFGSWMHRITANCCLDLLRRRKRVDHRNTSMEQAEEAGHTPPDPTPGPDARVQGGEIRAQVEQAMQLLTPVERTAFVLRHFEGHSITEIGSELDLGVSAAKQAVFRGVRKMRRALAPLMRTGT